MATTEKKVSLTEILRRSEPGDIIYTETKDAVIGSYAARAGVKVSTERILAIHAGKRELIDLTRVTVIGPMAHTVHFQKRTRA